MSKVMLVEDDNNLREIYEARLQAEGYTIVSARDGEEALVVAKAELPDLIISDVMMPKISGFEMLDILRNTEQLKSVKVIMLTALGQSDDQQRADKLGADRYLVKSQVTLEDIVKVAHSLLSDAPEEASASPEVPAADVPAAAVPVTAVPIETPEAPVSAVAPAPAPLEPSQPSLPVTAPVSAPVISDGDNLPVTAPTVIPEPVAATATPTTSPGISNPFSPVEVPDEEATSEPPSLATPEVTENPQSTAQEEASVEAKIEDFVSGASTDATPPLAATVPASSPIQVTVQTEPEPASEPASGAPAPTATQTTASATDDKLMADAVNKLVANGESEAAAATPQASTEAPAVVPDQASVPTEPEAVIPGSEPAAETVAAPNETIGDGTTVAHKKVIKPLDTPPKQDLDTLLALEATKEAVAAAPVAPVTVVGGATSAPTPVSPLADVAPVAPAAPSVAPAPAADDPSSIAL